MPTERALGRRWAKAMAESAFGRDCSFVMMGHEFEARKRAIPSTRESPHIRPKVPSAGNQFESCLGHSRQGIGPDPRYISLRLIENADPARRSIGR